MKLCEISVKYHRELNPKIWDGFRLKPEVLLKLREIAASFLKFLDVPQLKVDDLVVIGSCANFNWTDSSDIDLHLVMNLENVKKVCKSFTEELFDAKNDTWKERHDITIYGLPVEVFIQDNATNEDKEEGIERHITGVFSIKDDKWIRKPSYEPPEINRKDVKIKADSIKRAINKIVDNDMGLRVAKKLHGRLKKFRKAGLHEFGEFSTENLVFKELRNSGAMEKLLDYTHKAKSDKLSLELKDETA